jgi:hypothetical protein
VTRGVCAALRGESMEGLGSARIGAIFGDGSVASWIAPFPGGWGGATLFPGRRSNTRQRVSILTFRRGGQATGGSVRSPVHRCEPGRGGPDRTLRTIRTKHAPAGPSCRPRGNTIKRATDEDDEDTVRGRDIGGPRAALGRLHAGRAGLPGGDGDGSRRYCGGGDGGKRPGGRGLGDRRDEDLPTRFARIVVTDDQGRYVLPDLPPRPTTSGSGATGWSTRRTSGRRPERR